MSLSSCLLLALACLSVCVAQYPRQPLAQACPPALPINVCYPTCSADSQCRGFYKCCLTACGGALCSRPVTAPVLAQSCARCLSTKRSVIKSGNCPEVPTGPWVCSNRCSADEDCPGRTKCCRNRCGALACMLPQPLVYY